MAVIKCKSCGNEVTLPENVVQGCCTYCGGQVTCETPAAKPGDQVEVNTQLHRGRKKTIITLSIIAAVIIAAVAAYIATKVYVINKRQEVTKSVKDGAVTGGRSDKNVDDVCIVKDGVVTGVRGDKDKITSVVIPDGVTDIGQEAFTGCRSLTSVTIPNSVTHIWKYAFAGCRSLTSVTIGNRVTYIEYMAFYGCSSLTSVTIPKSVRTIIASAFNSCSSLREVRLPYGCDVGNQEFPAGCNVIRY